MRQQSASLAARRERLVASSTAQRAALLENFAPIGRAAATLDRIVAPVRRHPLVAAALVAVVAFAGSRRIFDLATRALTVYMLLRRR